MRAPCCVLLLLAALAARAADGDLRPCLAAGAGSDFLAVTEYVVLDAMTSLPAALGERDPIPAVEYFAALGADHPPAATPEDPATALVVRVAPQRWLLVASASTFVRRTAVSVIDARPGALHAVAPTPAVPGGAGVLAQPISRGVTLGAGSGRIFCGVRSQARSLAVSTGDVEALAARVGCPTCDETLAAITR